MDNIYVAIDESEASLSALFFGQSLAKQLNAAFNTISVVPDQETVATRHAAIQSHLLAYQLDTTGLDVVVHNSAKEYLGELAGRDEVGLCMMAHGRRPVSEMLVGSVTAGVVRRARKPIFLCGPKYDHSLHSRVDVLSVCLDGSILAEAMLPYAIDLSKRLGARLQLLQVLDMASLAKAPNTFGHTDVMESSYLHGLARRIEREHAMEVDWEVLHGDPADSILSYLADNQHAMLAMTTHGRSGLSQVVAGSVSHEVLHEAACPVAVLRP